MDSVPSPSLSQQLDAASFLNRAFKTLYKDATNTPKPTSLTLSWRTASGATHTFEFMMPTIRVSSMTHPVAPLPTMHDGDVDELDQFLERALSPPNVQPHHHPATPSPNTGKMTRPTSCKKRAVVAAQPATGATTITSVDVDEGMFCRV